MMQCPKCGAMTFTGKYCFSCQYTDKEKVQAGIKKAAAGKRAAKPDATEEHVQGVSSEKLSDQRIDSNSQMPENKAITGSIPAKASVPMSFDQLRGAAASPENQKVIKTPTKEDLDKIKGAIKDNSPVAQPTDHDDFSSDKLDSIGSVNAADVKEDAFVETEKKQEASEHSKPVFSWSDPAEFNETWKNTKREQEPDSGEIRHEAPNPETVKDILGEQLDLESQADFDDKHLSGEFLDPLLDDESNEPIASEGILSRSINAAEFSNMRADDALKNNDSSNHSLSRDYSKQEQEEKFDGSVKDKTAGDLYFFKGKGSSILESVPASDERPSQNAEDEPEPQRLNTGKGSAHSFESKDPGKRAGILGKFGKRKESEKEETLDPSTLSEDELFDKLAEDITEKEVQGKKKEKNEAKISEEEQYEMDRADFLDPDESVYNPNYDNYYDDVQADALSYPDKITAGDALMVVGIIAAIILFLVMMMFVI